MERDTKMIEAPKPKAETYEPPAVEWEEPFDPISATSDCCNPLEPGCNNPCF